jgi:hypothetical protein
MNDTSDVRLRMGSWYENKAVESYRALVERRRRPAAARAIDLADQRIGKIHSARLVVFKTRPHGIMMLHDPIVADKQAFHGSGNFGSPVTICGGENPHELRQDGGVDEPGRVRLAVAIEASGASAYCDAPCNQAGRFVGKTAAGVTPAGSGSPPPQ